MKKNKNIEILVTTKFISEDHECGINATKGPDAALDPKHMKFIDAISSAPKRGMWETHAV